MNNQLVIDFGYSIGVPYEWYRNIRPYYDWKDQWHDLLHELGHSAVIPQDALEEYQHARKLSKEEGNLSWGILTPGLIHPSQTLLAAQNYYPNEYVVRIWATEVLAKLGWVNPIEEEDYYAYPPGRRPRNPAQWIEPPAIFRGRQNYTAWGLDVANGIYRPLSEPTQIMKGSFCPLDRVEFVNEVEAAALRLDGNSKNWDVNRMVL